MLTFYTFVPSNWNASFYYRIFVPFHTARDLGLPIRVMVDTNDTSIGSEDRARAFCEADIVRLYQPIGDPTFQNARGAKSFIPSKRDGEWKYPPSLVVDSDDNLFHVTPYNTAFRGLGYKDPDGNEMPRGHMIGDVRDGQRRVLWHDGPCGPSCDTRGENCPKRIDVARNRHNIATYRNLINLSDCVTTSTPRVAEKIRENAAPRRIKVLPNLVRFDHYPQISLEKHPSRINILWQGGAAHYEDWHPLREALGNIVKKYPEAHFYIWGQLFHWVTELMPPERYTFINWCDYREYKLRLMMIDFDINLAPLAPTDFNQGRSAIKFYEGSMGKRPAATLAQATGPYFDEIIEGQTGLLFHNAKEFEFQLSRLIEDAALRKTLGANAKQWISENRDAFKEVPKHFEFYESLREKVKHDQPHMPEVEWAKFEEQMRREAEEAEKASETAEA